MQWVLDNWLLLLFGGGMIAMHLFGHGGHGKKHGGSSSGAPETKPRLSKADSAEEQRDL